MVSFADEMIGGLREHGDYFPTCDLDGLLRMREEYELNKDSQIEALEAYKRATERKDDSLARLIVKLKKELKRAENDAVEEPDRLEIIGWHDHSELTGVPPPGTPQQLKVSRVPRRPAEVVLKWKPPQRGSGGAVNFYEVQRRQRENEMGGYGEWSLAGVTMDTHSTLSNQPTEYELEYRVLAVNRIGKSAPSNTIEVI